MAKQANPGTSPGTQVTDAFSALLARFGDIFGVFDLSFFVAGTVCLGALAFGAFAFGATWLSSIDLGAWGAVHVAGAILASYVLGMVCFSAGRHAGRRLWRRRGAHARLAERLHQLGLDDHYRPLLPAPGASEKEATQRYDLLYTRLWAELRQDEDLAPSFNLITRYWILAAMCDGLAAAFGLWTVLWIFYAVHALGAEGHAGHPAVQVVALVGLGLPVATLLSSYEASRYGDYQMVELLATLAHRHVPVVPPPPAPEALPAVPELQVPPPADPPVTMGGGPPYPPAGGS